MVQLFATVLSYLQRSHLTIWLYFLLFVKNFSFSCVFPCNSQQRQQIQSLQTEIEGYKKSIQKEQENNETLTLMLQKNEIDINSLKKQIATSQAKQEQLKQEYSAYSRMLHETEQNLNRATTVKKESKQAVKVYRVG